jgi:hypothetical protein
MSEFYAQVVQCGEGGCQLRRIAAHRQLVYLAVQLAEQRAGR